MRLPVRTVGPRVAAGDADRPGGESGGLAVGKWHRAKPGSLLDWAAGLAAGLRSGVTIPEALRLAVDREADSPDGARRVVAELAHGRMMRPALLDWRHHAPSSDERLLVTALLVAIERGADAGVAVEVVVDRLRDQRFIESRRRVLTAQAQATAGLLVLLPIVFAGFTSLVRGAVPFAGRVGLALVSAGIVLDGLGFLWMRHLRTRWL